MSVLLDDVIISEFFGIAWGAAEVFRTIVKAKRQRPPSSDHYNTETKINRFDHY